MAKNMALYNVVVVGDKLKHPIVLPFIDREVANNAYWHLTRSGYNCEFRFEGASIYRTVDDAIETVELWSK